MMPRNHIYLKYLHIHIQLCEIHMCL
jgi:hypothetical protein